MKRFYFLNHKPIYIFCPKIVRPPGQMLDICTRALETLFYKMNKDLMAIDRSETHFQLPYFLLL